jgi:hypothetical protein
MVIMSEKASVIETPCRNVFVLGLDDFQLNELRTITDAKNMVFHQLLVPEMVRFAEAYSFHSLLTRAREQLKAFDGSIDAIVAHWDFPASVLMPILAREWGLPTASLESVVACEHKYWSRVEQAASIPEVVPAFEGFDPFDDNALDRIQLDYPYWIKPVKSHSSQLGFMIEKADDFHQAIPEIRANIRGIGDSFNEVLAMIDLPDGIAADSGNSCIAEQLIKGGQATVEGTMFQGQFAVHGVIDSPKDALTGHFSRYEYPAGALSQEVQKRMISSCERFLRHINYDNACWNIEFMYDEDADKLWLVEVNTRISQSHSELFAKVHGMSNHEVAIAIAGGTAPLMPAVGSGHFNVAAKCFIWTGQMEDGIVRRVPSAEEIARVTEAFPGTRVHIGVKVGDRLSELREQASYGYDLATLVIGAAQREDLIGIHDRCREMLPFEIDRTGSGR